jgi:hypothetical protein
MPETLTTLEQQVVDAARRGDWAGSETEPPDLTMEVRAELVRELLMGRRGDVDPRGVRLQGVRLTGLLDLDHVSAVTGLTLSGCALPDGLTCVQARLREVDLRGSHLPGLNAANVRTDGDLVLRDATVTTSGEQAGAVWLSGARIGGRLDLNHAEITNDAGPALRADRLQTDEGMTLRDATILGAGEEGAVWLPGARIGGQLDAEGARITNDTGPALSADALSTGNSLVLQGATLRGTDEDGALWLLGARIGSQLNLERARITNDKGPALAADNLHTGNNMSVTGATMTGTGEPGAVRLVGAHIGGGLNFVEAEVANDTGPALHADRLHTDQSTILRNATLRGAGTLGAVRMIGAHVQGELNLDHTEIANDTGPAVLADRLQTDNNLFLQDATVSGENSEGAVRLIGAHIGYQFSLDRTTVVNGTGPALYAAGLRTGSDVLLRNAAVSGNGRRGAVLLYGAHIGGQLRLDHAELTNDAGPALAADNLRVDLDVVMRQATVTGTGEHGAVRLSTAQVGGQLDLDRTEITNTTGPALAADSLRTDGALFAQETTIRGAGEHGALRLSGAHIHRQLILDGAKIANGSGPCLKAHDLHVDVDLAFRGAMVAGSASRGVVQLIGARVGGHLRLDGTHVHNASGALLDLTEAEVTGVLSLPATVVCPEGRTDGACPDGERLIGVRGLVFPALEGVTWRQWLHLLTHHTARYVPQPYQQLAAVERGSGHDNNARQVLIAQQEDLRRRTPETLGGRVARARHWLWGWLGRYGYRAHRLVAALAVVVALAAGLGYAAGQVATRPGHHAAERTVASGSPGTPCSTAELIGLGIDRGLPLGATGLRARCDLDTGTRWGQAFTYVIWALQALVWALATLAVAAYTGLVRKPA